MEKGDIKINKKTRIVLFKQFLMCYMFLIWKTIC